MNEWQRCGTGHCESLRVTRSDLPSKRYALSKALPRLCKGQGLQRKCMVFQDNTWGYQAIEWERFELYWNLNSLNMFNLPLFDMRNIGIENSSWQLRSATEATTEEVQVSFLLRLLLFTSLQQNNNSEASAWEPPSNVSFIFSATPYMLFTCWYRQFVIVCLSPLVSGTSQPSKPREDGLVWQSDQPNANQWAQQSCNYLIGTVL